MTLDDKQDAQNGTENLRLVCDIVAAYIGNNAVPPSELPAVIQSVHSTISTLSVSATANVPPKPAVPAKRSVTHDYIVCLEDGKKLKMLKRYLRSHFGLSPEDYRAKWDLPGDYPMVAPGYAAQRSEFAKKIGLGKKPKPPKAGRRH